MADTSRRMSFRNIASALLHGKMKQDAKDRVMRAFAAGEHPRARVDDRHRSRHRRGECHRDAHRARRALRPLAAAPAARARRARRASIASACCCISIRFQNRGRRGCRRWPIRPTDSKSPSAISQLRGPGDFFGTRQSGLPTLRTGDLLRDHSLMEQARDEAVRFLDQQALTAAARRTHESRLAEPIRVDGYRIRLNNDQFQKFFEMQIV